MAVKTITIDTEAYSRLKRQKQPNESFSQLIKRIVPPPFDFDAWADEFARHPLDDKAAAAVRQQIAHRRKPSSRRR